MIIQIFNSSVVSGPEILVLPSLLRLGETVRVIFLMETRVTGQSRCPVEYAKKLGLQVETVFVRSRWDRVAITELRNVLDRLQPRITHAHDVKASFYLHQAKKLRPGFQSALLSTHHGVQGRKGKIRLYEEYYVRRVLPHYDRVLSVCTQDRASLIRRGVAEERIAVHLNGADRALVPSESRNSVAVKVRNEWKKRNPGLPAPQDAIFLGAVARLSPEKRHDRMLNVLRSARHSHTNEYAKKPVLLCFGIGPEEARLKNLARKWGITDSVFWMGYSDTIGEEMAGFDALLSLSDGEGIPISLLEAGWAGTPVLSTAVGGVPDLISTPAVGYLVEKQDSDERIASRLCDMLKDRVEMRRVGKAFQSRVASEFSESTWRGRLLEEYAKLGLSPGVPRA